MQRMTRTGASSAWEVDAGLVNPVAGGAWTGPAIERLAALEDAIELIKTQRAEAAEKLERLKAQGRIRSAQAQQLLSQKLMLSSMLTMLGEDARAEEE